MKSRKVLSSVYDNFLETSDFIAKRLGEVCTKEKSQVSQAPFRLFCFYFLLSKKENATRCNNDDDSLHSSFTLAMSIFSEVYLEPSGISMVEILLRK